MLGFHRPGLHLCCVRVLPSCEPRARALLLVTQSSISAELSKFASERPELYKAVLAAMEEVLACPGRPCGPWPMDGRRCRIPCAPSMHDVPELVLCAQADKPGITPTVAVAKDPKACKYTEEGTMLHEMMQRVAAADRRMKVISDLEISLSAADKEAIKNAQLAKATELGIDASAIKADIPST